MRLPVFPNRRFMQNSWVVNDLQEAMERWSNTLGSGPFFHVKGIVIEQQMHRAQAVSVEAEFALAQAGEMQIELVCQLNDSPSAYRDTIAKGEKGFHHMARYCEDYDADLAAYTASGTEISFSGSVGGKRFCYLDTSPQLGCMIELIEASHSQAEFFSRIREEALDWDGSNPVRPAF